MGGDLAGSWDSVSALVIEHDGSDRGSSRLDPSDDDFPGKDAAPFVYRGHQRAVAGLVTRPKRDSFSGKTLEGLDGSVRR
jgi:hypothetical protein